MTIIAMREAEGQPRFGHATLTVAVATLGGRVECHRGQEQGKAETHEQEPGHVESRPVVAEVFPASSLDGFVLTSFGVLALDLRGGGNGQRAELLGSAVPDQEYSKGRSDTDRQKDGEHSILVVSMQSPDDLHPIASRLRCRR